MLTLINYHFVFPYILPSSASYVYVCIYSSQVYRLQPFLNHLTLDH